MFSSQSLDFLEFIYYIVVSYRIFLFFKTKHKKIQNITNMCSTSHISYFNSIIFITESMDCIVLEKFAPLHLNYLIHVQKGLRK